MPSGQHEERAWLVFRLGPHLLCASALDVEGIIEPVRPRPVPFTPPYVLGWFDFRGQVASVVSLRRKFGVRSGEDSPAGPYVVARVQEDLAAFWVDEVRDVLEGHQADWKPMPPMPGTAVFDRYTIRDADVILHTTFEGLLRADAAAALPAPAEAPAKAEPAVTAVPGPAPAPPEDRSTPPAPPLRPAPPREVPPVPRRPARPEAPRPVPRAPRKPAPRPVELPPPPPPPPRPYQPQDFEVDAVGPEAREEGGARWGWRLSVPAVLIALVAAGVLGWQASVPEAPTAVPVTATGPIVPAARVATVKTETFTLTVDRPAKAAPPPAVAPNPEPADNRITHVVVRGDTLSHIAYRYLGDGARYPELARLSRIRDPDLIHPGDIVTIRQTAPPRR